MTPLKTKEIRTNLCKKGFKMHQSDHEFYVFEVNGKNSEIRTKISHGEKEIAAPLITRMAKQLHLSNNQFEDFAKCKMSEKEYKEILIQKEII